MKAIRIKGVIHGLIGSLAGLIIYWYWSKTLAIVVWSITAFTFLAAELSPLGVYSSIEKAIGGLTWLIGSLVTWMLLLPLYYLIFMPTSFLFRRGSRDRLARNFPGKQESYWEKHRPAGDIEKSYLNQF
jgi:hypothetical protein